MHLLLWTVITALVIPCAVESSAINTEQLISLVIVHRHGDRSIISTYPKDPYLNSSYWPDGFGELTLNGKRRMYKLGQYLRKRYANYLTFNPLEVTVRSSAMDRCLESAGLVLGGAYPPQGRWIWNDHLPWQPFPIQTVELAKDGMLNPDSDCPAAQEEQERIRQGDFVKKINEEHQQLYNYLSNATGENVTDLFVASYIYDALYIERLQGYKLPEWADDKTLSQMSNLTNIAFYARSLTRLMQRYRAGEVLKQIQDIFSTSVMRKQKLTNSLDYRDLDMAQNSMPKKVHFFSSHDTLVSVLLNSLGVFNKIAPPYGSTVMFELYQNQEYNYVKSYYLNDTYSETPIELNVPTCDGSAVCTLTQFFDQFSDIIPQDWEQECKLSPSLLVDVHYMPGKQE